MYLCELDPKDGLILIAGQWDGIMAIAEFRDIVNNPELGRECMTAVALTLDWQSPIRYYTEKDRPGRAMKEVKQDVKAWVWDREEIQAALIKYSDLQYNASLVEKNQYDQMEMEIMAEIRSEKDRAKQLEGFKQLDTIKGLKANWLKANADLNPFAEGPIVNGYALSRLEEKQLDRNSFYNKKIG